MAVDKQVSHDHRLQAQVAIQPYPLLFVTISGAHLYGFASPDSDYDLRGAHILPMRQVLGLYAPSETIQVSEVVDGLEIDLVTHDVRKFFALLLKNSGYALEQVLSPLVVFTTPEHEELKALARASVTRLHVRHYFGFAENQWRLFEKRTPHRIKPLLYIYRVLLTGIHLMRTGEVEANLLRLNDEFRSPQVADLIARKTSETEQATLLEDDLTFYRAEYERLRDRLRGEEEKTFLPHIAANAQELKTGLNDLLLRLRMDTLEASLKTREDTYSIT
jgi:hypothetical protein